MEENRIRLLPILRKIPIFHELSDDDYEEIAKNVTLEYFSEGFVIFNEGEEGDALFIIKEGAISIFHPPKSSDEEAQEIAVLTENAFFGEMALVSQQPRNASAKAKVDTLAFMLKKESFYQLMVTNPSMASRINEAFMQRLKENIRKS